VRVTVCQIPNEPAPLAEAWVALSEHLAGEESDLLVLPEMPFSPWLAGSPDVDSGQWREAAAEHRRWCDRLGELGVGAVLGSRPVDDPEPRNRAFIWRADEGLADLHDKVYLPNESGFWEANWYGRGRPDYELATVATGAGASARVGALLCTELWFFEHARTYGRAGAGAYCLSAAPYNAPGQGADLGGGGWIIDPEGEVLALTTPEEPFATRRVDLAGAEAAKKLYPRYVPEAE